MVCTCKTVTIRRINENRTERNIVIIRRKNNATMRSPFLKFETTFTTYRLPVEWNSSTGKILTEKNEMAVRMRACKRTVFVRTTNAVVGISRSLWSDTKRPYCYIYYYDTKKRPWEDPRERGGSEGCRRGRTGSKRASRRDGWM